MFAIAFIEEKGVQFSSHLLTKAEDYTDMCTTSQKPGTQEIWDVHECFPLNYQRIRSSNFITFNVSQDRRYTQLVHQLSQTW